MSYLDFGEKLKYLRKKRNLTQTELGSLTGLNKAVISKYENSMHYPSYDTLVVIARVFKVSTDYLLGIEKGRTIDVTGLTESQIETINSIIHEYRQLGTP